MKKEIICTVCPRGCHIFAEGEEETVSSVSGNACRRGYTYACAEFAHPVRILTTTVRIAGHADTLLPVRSSKPIPKEMLLPCMEVIRSAEAPASVHRYDVIIPDILKTGADIIATGPFGLG